MTSQNAIPHTLNSARVKKARLRFAVSIFVLVWSVSVYGQSKKEEQHVAGVPLDVHVPQGWHMEPASANTPIRIIHDSEPRYSLTFSSALVSVTCAQRLKSLEAPPSFSPSPQNATRPKITLGPRPSFVPDPYSPVTAFAGRDVLLCIDLGSKIAMVALLPLGDDRDLILRPVLEAIAEAAIVHADFVRAPGVAKFPTLDVTIHVDSGKWMVSQHMAIGGRPRDTLVRLDSTIPLELSFAEFAPIAQECRTLYTDSGLGADQRKLVRSPAYVGGKWYPAAWEQRPLDLLQSYVCREISPRLFLVAQISYGTSAVTEQDVMVIRDLLDRVADAVEHGPHLSRAAADTILDLASPDSGILPNPVGVLPFGAPAMHRPGV